MDSASMRRILETPDEREIARLKRELDYQKRLATQWKDTAARLDIYIQQKNAHIEKLEMTVKYLRNR